MRTLSVVGLEDGAIVAVSEAGDRFRIPADDVARVLRDEPQDTGRRLSPREIQAHVRAGLTPQQVAALTGAPLGYVERFTGPVVAERRWIVDSALACRVAAADDGSPRAFGALMGDRLAALDAEGVRWASAKEPSGWIVGVTFVADGIEHSARWRFDPKRRQLAPENVEAATLSQEGVPAALTPRLRAIDPTTPVPLVPRTVEGPRPAPAPEPDRSRFDSAVFSLPDLASEPETPEPAKPAAVTPAAAVKPAKPAAVPAAFRKPVLDEDLPPTQAMPAIRGAHRAPESAPDEEREAPVTRLPERAAEQQPVRQAPRAPQPVRRGRPRAERRGRPGDEGAMTKPVTLPTRGRGGRTSMPSWDEIVFGRDED